MGGLINFTDAVEKKDAGLALNTAATSFVDPSSMQSIEGVAKEQAS